jgi:outer membrane protein assembly factor BamB
MRFAKGIGRGGFAGTLLVLVGLAASAEADVVSYREGDGKGAVSETNDTYIDETTPSTNYGGGLIFEIDQAPHRHALLKFPNIFGNGVNQIPPGSVVLSATLTVQVVDTGSTCPTLYQLTEGWTELEATWISRRTAVSWTDAGADGPTSHQPVAGGTLPCTLIGTANVSVTASVQNWSNGEANEGWVLINAADNDGIQLTSSEEPAVANRPQLTVSFVPPVTYSVGTNASDLKTGSPSVAIAGGVATFSVPQAANVGVGDQVTYNVSSVAYISHRVSDTVYGLRTATGGLPADVAGLPVNSIRRAFNSLSAAQTGSSNAAHLTTTNLVAGGYRLQWACYNDGPINDRLDLTGWTTGANNFIRIFTPASPSEVGASQRHLGIAGTGFRLAPIDATIQGFDIIHLRTPYARVEGLEIDGSGLSNATYVRGVRVLQGLSNTGDIRVDSTIVHDLHTTRPGINADGSFGIYAFQQLANNGPPMVVTNNIIYDVTANTTDDNHHIGGIHIGARATSYVHNNTVYSIRHNGSPPGGQAYGLEVSAFPGGTGTATVVAKNNFIGDVVALSDVEFAFNANNNGVLNQTANVSSDGTASGPGSQTGRTAYGTYFQSITSGSENLHLRQNSNVLWGSFGVDLASDPNAPVTDDVDGQARRPATPDIGADELNPPTVLHRSLGTNAVNLNVGARTVAIAGSTATFSGAMPDNIGVGDALEYRILATTYLAFIQARTSASVYTVASKSGGLPQPAAAGTAVSVYRAYTSLSAWEVLDENNTFDNTVEDFDTTTDLVGSNAIMSVAAYGDGVDSTSVVINGWTTSASHYIRIYTPYAPTEVGVSQRHSGRWDPTKYRMEAGTTLLRIEDEHVRLDGLQLRLTADVASATGVFFTGGAAPSELEVSNCILRGNGTGVTNARTGLLMFTAASGVARVWNNLVYDWAGGTNVAGIVADDPDFTFYLYNNTVVDNQTGIQRVSGTVTAKNNLAYNNVDNYSGTFQASSTSNLSGPSQIDAPGASPRNATIVTFVNAAADDFHLSLTDTGAQNFGANLSADANLAFSNDIDLGLRAVPWDIGADEAGTSGGAPTISSAANQSFIVGSPPQTAATLTITDALAVPGITSVNDLRIRIPAGISMLWDGAVTSITVGGAQAAKVDGSLVTYEDAGKTAVVNVVLDFASGEQVTVAGLRFRSFTAPSVPVNLELEVKNDDVVSAVDDKTVAIVAGTQPVLSSDASLVFALGGAPTPASPFTITDGTTAVIENATDLRVRIPDGVEMTWDVSVTTIAVSGTAAGDVSTLVTYEDWDRTVVINVTNPSGFAPGAYLRVANLKFANFDAVSPPGFLELEIDNLGTVADLDDKTVAIDGVGRVQVLTATSTDRQVLLEWVNPRYGQYSSTRILRKRETDGCPSGPLDGSAVVVYDDGSVGLAAKDSIVDPIPDVPSCPASLCNDVTYCYVAYVDDGGSTFSGPKTVKARPFDNSGRVKWAYSTGAATLSPPGLGWNGGGALAVYQASNDDFFHAMKAGPTGGMWPTGPDWIPFKMLKPSQHRPAVVPVPVGAASRVAYVGSQDGHVYAIDADTGALVWKSPTLGQGVQAAPAVIFTAPPYSRAYDLILVGTRNPGGANAFYGLNVNDGSVAWTFDNGGSGLGAVNGGAVMDYTNNRVCFASWERNLGDDTVWCLSFAFSGSWNVVNEWSDPIGNVSGSPIIMNGKLYVGTDGGDVHAYDALNGTPLWTRALGDGLVKTFVFPHFGTTELFLSTMSKIHCLDDATNGLPCSPSWPESGVTSPSTPLNVPFTTKLFVGSGDGSLYQLKTDNSMAPVGVQLGDGSSVVGAPTFDIFNNLIYVGTDAGFIYAVEPLP